MQSLKDTEIRVAMEVPEAAGAALKALKAGTAFSEQQKIAYNFIVYELAGILKLGFAAPGEVADVNWHNGRRFVGLQIDIIVKTPMPEQPEVPQQPARTLTEAARRRRAGA